MDDLAEKLDLKQVMDRNVENLSGGELQRFAIAMCAAGKADVYMIDEPSSYLDVRQRLKAAQVRSQVPCAHHCSCMPCNVLLSALPQSARSFVSMLHPSNLVVMVQA